MSISSRYLITLFSNLIRAGLNFFVSVAVARYFLPEQYGDYQYLVSVFTAILLFANMGTEKAYFTFISEEIKPFKFHLFYYIWQLAQLLILFLFFAFLNHEWLNKIFQNIDIGLIYLALIALFMAGTVQTTIIHLFESVRKTAYVQLLSIGVSLLHLCLILLLIMEKSLTIKIIFLVMIVEYTVYLVAALIILKKNKIRLASEHAFDIKQTFNEFYKYSKPLFLFMLIAFLYTFFDRWLIQKYVGSEGQAFFSIAIQFSALSILVSSSILKIFWKEIAEAIRHNNRAKVKQYFLLISGDMFIFTTMISVTLYFFSDGIVRYFYGDAYAGSLFVFELIMLYTIPQSLGQLYATYFMATSQTSLYTKISYFFMLINFPLSFYLLSDAGMQLDEAGIAMKMLGLNILSIIVLEYYISKHLDIPMFILKKMFIVIGFFVVTFVIHNMVCRISDDFFYRAALVGFLYIFPIMVYLFRNLAKGV